MPSYLKFRIKHPTETKHCALEDYPSDLKKELENNKVISPNDINITNSTCAFLMKFSFEGTTPTDKVFYGDSAGNPAKSIYLCGIRFSTKNVLLKPPETNNPIVEEDKYFVSGAKKIEDSDELTNIKNYDYYKDIFICKYIDKWTAKSEIGPNNLVKACMCNCYCPRGGLGAGFNAQNYDGALKDIGAFNMDSNNVIYDEMKDGDSKIVKRAYAGPILKNLPKDKKLLNEPRQLSYLYMMLNARAAVMTCCYWNNPQVLVYQPNWFRTIDLAYAKLNAKVNDKITKTMVGTDLVENYSYIESDYYPKTADDYEVKNRLLNRNYDFTLPNTPVGNNARILITLKQEITGGLVKDDNKSTDCARYNNWHYHNEGYFCPENCAHPNYEVKYKWGCVCNGGGAFSLDDQLACPYYHSPIAGDKDSDLNCALSKLYPGDYVSAAAILELMWLSKAGLPWTQKEWEARWKVPYIWVTLPYSPIDINEWGQRKPTTQSIYTEDGVPKDVFYTDDQNKRHKKAAYVPRIISKKVSINYQTGIVEKSAAYALPGGSLTAYKVGSDGAVVTDAKIPDFPTFINSLVLDSLSNISIYFPRTDFTTGLVTPEDIEGMKAYVNLKQKTHNIPYNKLIWNENGAYTLILGTARGRFEKVYCLNTAFLINQWLDFTKLELILTGSASYLAQENQDVIRQLFDDLMQNDLNTDKMCLGRTDAFKELSMADTDSTFLFRNIPLNILIDKNLILVLAQDQYGEWIVDWVYIRPQFRHAWTYQKETTLLSDWKSWNGRPKHITNNEKVQIGKATDTDKKYLTIPEKSGITKWKYFDIAVPNLTDYNHSDPKEAKTKQADRSPYSYGDLEPHLTYQPLYANKSIIYDSREDKSLQSTLGAKLGGIGVTVASGTQSGAILPKDLESYLQNVKPGNGGEVGSTTWYSLSACSPYVIIVGDPTIFSIQNELMIYSMTATIKDDKGNITGEVPLIPVAYTQVNRKLPSYTEKKSTSDTTWKTPSNLYFWDLGICDEPEPYAPVKTVKDEGVVEIQNPLINLLMEETDAHNWVIIAKAISLDKSKVPTWLDYLTDKPSEVVNADSVILMRANTDLYMQYAYIKKKEYPVYGESVSWSADSCETAITPNVRGNIYRTLFKYKPWNNDFKVDNLEEVICGAKTSHALWPYHRIGCRDVEINYSWANLVYTYQCLPYHLYCIGPRTIYGPIMPFTGNQISGDANNANLIGKYVVLYNSCCGDHDFSQSCHSFHGSLYYPYTTGCDLIPMYDVISDCLWDFSYALPYELIQQIKSGKELPYGLERLRGPRQYTPTCQRDPVIETMFQKYPCVAQTIYSNTIRSVKPNSFDGFVRTRGPVYQDEMHSMSPAGNVGAMPKFGNVGREINVVSLDYMVEKVYGNQEQFKYRYELFESPPTQGSRSLPVLTSKAINPYFYYIMSDPTFGENFNPTSTTCFTTKTDKLLKEGYEKTIAYSNPDDSISDSTVHWVWPEYERDKLARGVNHAKKSNNKISSKEGLQINSIMQMTVPPYKLNNYNGDISLGPTISKDGLRTSNNYLIYAKSEYYDPKTNTYHKPIVGSKDIGTSTSISQLDEKSIDVDLKYEVLDTGIIDNSDIEGSKHLKNTLSNAANFITSTEESYVYTSDTVPVMAISGSSMANKKPKVTKKTTRNYIIEYELTNINLGKDILRSFSLTFNSKVAQWSSKGTGTVALSVTVKNHSGGNEVTKNLGFITNESGTDAILNYKEAFGQGLADIKFTFDVKEWYGIYNRTDTVSFSYSPETAAGVGGNAGETNVTTQSFYDSQPATIGSSFWSTGDMEDAISEIKMYAYKKESFYPGLYIDNILPNHLAKYPSVISISDNKLNSTFKISQGFKIISLENTNAELNLHNSVYKVDYELNSDFIKNSNVSMIVDFTGATVSNLVTTSGVSVSSDSTELVTKTIKITFPMTNNKLSYILDFDMLVDLNYRTRINCIVDSATNGFLPTTNIFKANGKTISFQDLKKLKLKDIISSMKITVLKPGEEGEVITIDQTGFWYSLGDKCKRGSSEYNFYSESKNEDYQVKWATSLIGSATYDTKINMPIMIDSSTDVSTGLLVEGLSPETDSSTMYPKEFAPPYPKGELILKGNSYIFDVQYKDAWDVTKNKAENNEYTFNVIGGDAKDVTGKYEQFQKELWNKANNLRNENKTQFLIEALIPMQDWYPIWVLTGGKYVQERNIDLDKIATRTNKRKPLYYDQLKTYRETKCEFNWHRWKWNEVLDWSFSGEERKRYGPKPNDAVGDYAGGKPEWSPPGHAVHYTPSTPIMIDYFGISQTIEWTILFFSLQKTMYAWNDQFQVPWAYDQVSQEFKEAMEGYGDLSEANVLNSRYQEYLNKEYFWMFRNKDYMLKGHATPNNYYNLWLRNTSMEATNVPFASFARLDSSLF